MRGLAAGVLVLATVLAGVAPGGEPELVVIVHPSRTETLSATDVARIFLRKRRFWGDGAPIIPLNREVASPERATFTARVIGDGAAFLAQYWNEQYFAGVFPPTVLSSGAAVRRYVASDRDAIGYLRPAEVDESVRVALTLRAPE